MPKVRLTSSTFPVTYEADRCRPVQGGLDKWKSQISIRSLTEAIPARLAQDPPPKSLIPSLCYSCQGTLTSRSSKSVSISESGAVVSLPVWTQAKLVDRERMKGEIREFLLDDDGE
jgi:hypothetical protein